MYKILKSTTTGLDELDLTQLEKGAWIDVVAPDSEELKTLAAATKIPWIS
jgi:Mg2+ and Co2+ transporter CorA